MGFDIFVNRQNLSSCTFVSLSVLTNNSVLATERCKLSGVATSIQSACQTFTPALAGAVFKWALETTSNDFPDGVNLNFVVSSLILLSCAVLAYTLPKSLDKPYSAT